MLKVNYTTIIIYISNYLECNRKMIIIYDMDLRFCHDIGIAKLALPLTLDIEPNHLTIKSTYAVKWPVQTYINHLKS